jgi:hypothetical protein
VAAAQGFEAAECFVLRVMDSCIDWGELEAGGDCRPLLGKYAISRRLTPPKYHIVAKEWLPVRRTGLLVGAGHAGRANGAASAPCLSARLVCVLVWRACFGASAALAAACGCLPASLAARPVGLILPAVVRCAKMRHLAPCQRCCHRLPRVLLQRQYLTVEVLVGGKVVGTGTHWEKCFAERAAAKQALQAAPKQL